MSWEGTLTVLMVRLLMGAREEREMMNKKTEESVETDEQFSQRIRIETRKKILESSEPLNLESMVRSMEIEEPTHLGNLSRRPKLGD